MTSLPSSAGFNPSSPSMLTSAYQLCLAHYCDLHGPTPLMVTEGLPVPCSTCFDQESPFPEDRPSSAASQPVITQASPHSVAAITDALRSINFSATHRSASVPASEEEAQAHRASLLRTAASTSAATAAAMAALSSGSAIETPPASPSQTESRKLPPAHVRRDSSFRKTYDEYATKRANPCDNCAMTLPKQHSQGAGAGGRSSTDSNTKLRNDARGPTLRTKTPYAWVFGGTNGQDSPPNSQPSSASDTDGDAEEDDGELAPDELGRKRLRRTGTSSTTSRSSVFSNATTPSSHTHYIEYISTKEPVLPASFSIIRASCLRTLSFETLPRTQPSASISSAASSSSQAPPTLITSHSGGNTASGGGPIFFGDPLAGYTTAYIFRIPDVHARGHKRIYAFLALSTHKERVAMKTFSFIAAAFREMAAWIQQLAEAEAERASSDATGQQQQQQQVAAGTSLLQASSAPQHPAIQDGGSAFDRPGGGSAFRSRRGIGGVGGGGGIALKARGLPELVGMPEFFVQLHVRFVQILRELGVKMNA